MTGITLQAMYALLCSIHLIFICNVICANNNGQQTAAAGITASPRICHNIQNGLKLRVAPIFAPFFERQVIHFVIVQILGNIVDLLQQRTSFV